MEIQNIDLGTGQFTIPHYSDKDSYEIIKTQIEKLGEAEIYQLAERVYNSLEANISKQDVSPYVISRVQIILKDTAAAYNEKVLEKLIEQLIMSILATQIVVDRANVVYSVLVENKYLRSDLVNILLSGADDYQDQIAWIIEQFFLIAEDEDFEDFARSLAHFILQASHTGFDDLPQKIVRSCFKFKYFQALISLSNLRIGFKGTVFFKEILNLTREMNIDEFQAFLDSIGLVVFDEVSFQRFLIIHLYASYYYSPDMIPEHWDMIKSTIINLVVESVQEEVEQIELSQRVARIIKIMSEEHRVSILGELEQLLPEEIVAQIRYDLEEEIAQDEIDVKNDDGNEEDYEDEYDDEDESEEDI